MTDNVYTPKHYTQGDHECIDEIKAMLTPDEFRGFLKGNVLKYRFRANLKNGKEDLAKADNYAHYLIYGEFIKPKRCETTESVNKCVVDNMIKYSDFGSIADKARAGHAPKLDDVKSWYHTRIIASTRFDAVMIFIDNSKLSFSFNLPEKGVRLENVIEDFKNWYELS